MRGKLTPYLQLIRLPNVLTAAADSLAGWLLVTRLAGRAGRWLPLVGCLDGPLRVGHGAQRRVRLRDRPRASGRAGPCPRAGSRSRTAAWLGGLGLLLGPALAWPSGSVVQRRSWPPLLAACILAYDAGLKHTPLGPAFMGACRGLNLLLGMTHAPELGGPIAWCAAARLWPVRRRDHRDQPLRDHEGDRRGLVAGLTLQDLALLGLAAAAMTHRRFPYPAPDRPLIPLEGLLVLALVAMVVNQAAAAAIKQPTPRSIQRTVKTGILSLVWLDVGLVAAVRGIEPAAIVAVLWVPAFLLGRWLYST